MLNVKNIWFTITDKKRVLYIRQYSMFDLYLYFMFDLYLYFMFDSYLYFMFDLYDFSCSNSL